LSGLKFAEKQLIAVASSHMSLIYLKNGTSVSRGHCVAVEQDIAKLFLVLPRHTSDLDFLCVGWYGGSSDQEVYENIFKVYRKKLLASLYWLGHHILTFWSPSIFWINYPLTGFNLQIKIKYPWF
jgi:hypothetical protein